MSCDHQCGLLLQPSWLYLDIVQVDCRSPDDLDETSQMLGQYPLCGDFLKLYGFDLVTLGDLIVYQKVTLPLTKVWRVCSDLVIEADGELIIEGDIIIGEEP